MLQESLSISQEQLLARKPQRFDASHTEGAAGSKSKLERPQMPTKPASAANAKSDQDTALAAAAGKYANFDYKTHAIADFKPEFTDFNADVLSQCQSSAAEA